MIDPSAPIIEAIFPFSKAVRTSFGVVAYPSCYQRKSAKERNIIRI